VHSFASSKSFFNSFRPPKNIYCLTLGILVILATPPQPNREMH